MNQYLSLNKILLVKLKDVFFRLPDLKLYRHQFNTFSNVVHHLKLRNAHLIQIWRHWFFAPLLGAVCSAKIKNLLNNMIKTSVISGKTRQRLCSNYLLISYISCILLSLRVLLAKQPHISEPNFLTQYQIIYSMNSTF